MDLAGLKQTFQFALGELEGAGLVNYKRVFRIAAMAGNTSLAAYFASKIVETEWKEKGAVSVTSAFTVQEVAGIPAEYLWAFAHPLMVDEKGKPGGTHHPMPREDRAGILAIQTHFKGVVDKYNGEQL